MRNEYSVRHALDALVDGIFDSGTRLVIDGSFYREIEAFVDHKSLDAKSPEQLTAEARGAAGPRLLDFGCGTGGHRKMLEAQGYEWTGLNYKEGMATEAAEVAHQMNDDRIFFYDGENIPFADESFDVVYSFQTFEHIQNIAKTFSELHRVLKPGGRLVGAVSYLEQIHDYSTFNFTPIGFKLVVTKAGFRLLRLYPRSDVFSFLLRRLLVVTSASDDNSLSPTIHVNNHINKRMAEYVSKHADIKSANLLRLMFSAHFAFDVEKQ